MEIKKALWWIQNTAASNAEDGLLCHQFNHSNEDSLDLRRERILIDIAVYLYSVIWNVNTDIIRMAIMEISKTYSKGNLYGIKELDRDIKKLVENKIGREIEITGTDETVEDVINHLFLWAAEKYRENMGGEKYASAEYITLKDAVYVIVFHLWKKEPEQSAIDEPILASFVDVNMTVEATVKEIAEMKTDAEDIREVYEKHYKKECRI